MNISKILFDRLAVKPVTTGEKVVSGIIVPDTLDNSWVAEVMYLGPDVEEEVVAGDLVVLRIGVGFPIQTDGGGVFVISEKDILAVVV